MEGRIGSDGENGGYCARSGIGCPLKRAARGLECQHLPQEEGEWSESSDGVQYASESDPLEVD